MEQVSVYDTVELQQTGGVKDLIVSEPDMSYLLTDGAVCISCYKFCIINLNCLHLLTPLRRVQCHHNIQIRALHELSCYIKLVVVVVVVIFDMWLM